MGDFMKDNNKTKRQLIHELAELRSQNAELKKSTNRGISTELPAEEARSYAESIVEAVREPLLVLDANLKILSANRAFYKTFQVTPDETIGSFIYDLGNRQWDIPILRKLLEEVLRKKEAFDDFEVAHNFQDIGQKIMLLNARRIDPKDNGAEMILLSIEDITERKRLEDLLTESEARFRRVFETASDGIVLLEKSEGKITHANPAIEKLLGYTIKEIIGKKLQDIGIVDIDDFQTIIQNLNEIGIINYDNVPVETRSGQHIDTDIYFVDRARLAQCNIRDITNRKRAEEALKDSEQRYRELSILDGLTQLYNSRYFYLQLNIEIERAKRYKQPLTLLLLDLDDFKAFNDTYGHVEGDEVLSRLGQVMKRLLRATDSAYRYGGEEFTVILPMTTSENGAFIAERIRTEFKKETFSPTLGQDVHMMVSIGLAQHKTQEDMKAFVRRVDQLMYQAKKNGKDSVYCEQ